jgi:hypothetical protein
MVDRRVDRICFEIGSIGEKLYPSKEALDHAIAGMEGGMSEAFEQRDELLVTLGASVGRA